MHETVRLNGETVWKYLTVSFGSVLLAIAGWYLTQNRDAVTKQDLKETIAPMQLQLDDHTRQLGEVKESIIQLDVDTARISEHLGVSAHPGTRSEP